MFGLGMMEIGLIVAIAVMLFPPTELPKLVRSIARIYGQVRRTAEDFKNTVLEDEDLRSPIDEIKGAYNDARWEVRDAERKARQQLAKAQMDMRMATARRIQAEREAEAKRLADGGAAKGEAGDGGGGEASAISASAASPVRVAAADPDDDHDDDAGAPVPAPDPRVAARAPGFYTPPASSAPTSAPSSGASSAATSAEPGDTSEAREGVA